MDTIENRVTYFDRSLFLLGRMMKQIEYINIKKIIGLGGVDEIWLHRYYDIISKFIEEMNFYGKNCYFLVKKSYFKAIDNYVTKNCSDKAISVFKDLKSTQWKYIDKTWYDELIYDKEVELLDLVKLGCVR